MLVLDALVPIVSLFIGSGITYWVNVRSRRRTYVEDLFNQAIAAVAAAEASVDFTSNVGQPAHMSDADYASFQSWLVTEGVKNWSIKLSEANLALARVAPYRPEIEQRMPFSPGAERRGTHREFIKILQLGPRRR